MTETRNIFIKPNASFFVLSNTRYLLNQRKQLTDGKKFCGIIFWEISIHNVHTLELVKFSILSPHCRHLCASIKQQIDAFGQNPPLLPFTYMPPLSMITYLKMLAVLFLLRYRRLKGGVGSQI